MTMTTSNSDEITAEVERCGDARDPSPSPPRRRRQGYVVTGRAAHGRVGRLFRNLLEEEEEERDRRRRREGQATEGEEEGRSQRRSTSTSPSLRDRWIDASPYAESDRPAPSSPPSFESEGPAPPAPPPPPPVAFLWENAPRSETRPVRDSVRCYSHLPHGIILDDKWALARLLGGAGRRREGSVGGRGGDGAFDASAPDDDAAAAEVGDDATTDNDLAVLESHCFRGAEFAAFARRVGLLPPDDGEKGGAIGEECSAIGAPRKSEKGTGSCRGADATTTASSCEFEDLLPAASSASGVAPPSSPPPSPDNLWVVKDAMSNGAGGIWIVDPSNVREFLDDDDDDDDDDDGGLSRQSSSASRAGTPSSALHPTHRYVAQRYAWPPALYGGRKCHVRVYGLVAGDGRAYVHRRAFLHVANEPFRHDAEAREEGADCARGGGREEGGGGGGGRFEASVHITNCCANSHDPDKFSGEICADLELPGPFSVRNRDGRREPGSPNDDANGAILPLGDYLPSVSASVAALARCSAPFVRGGEANGGFEYLGLDFVLSSAEVGGRDGGGWPRRRPAAYLLEVNAPPSQDTATGLSHAEELHDDVISDLLRMWVLPNLGIGGGGNGGWRCVYAPPPLDASEEGANPRKNLVVPSKAAISNRMRWAVFERRALREEELLRRSEERQREDEARRRGARLAAESLTSEDGSSDTRWDQNDRECESSEAGRDRAAFDPDAFVAFARSQFPYFAEPSNASSDAPPEKGAAAPDRPDEIFLESGGGAQVPRVVSDAVAASLSHRDRSLVGATCQREARAALSSLLIDDAEERPSSPPTEGPGGRRRRGDGDRLLVMGSNASSLLDSLARKIGASGVLAEGDEVVIASENHRANVTPWLDVAGAVGAKVRWWTVADTRERRNDGVPDSAKGAGNDGDRRTESCILSELINERTRVVAMSHASNILGMERDVRSVCDLVRRATRGRGQVVVDGVAVAPHLLAYAGSDAEGGPDWYVASLHKLFGPHLGCLVGRRCRMEQLRGLDSMAYEEGRLSDEMLCKSWEVGTMNYEACCGAIGLKKYFETIAVHAWERFGLVSGDVTAEDDEKRVQVGNRISSESLNSRPGVREGNPYENGRRVIVDVALSHLSIARTCIQRVEMRLIHRLLGHLQKCAPLVRLIQDSGEMKVTNASNVIHSLVEERIPQRMPIACFVHAEIPSREIVRHCRNYGVACRACKFLSTERLWDELGVEDDGVVRFSLAHYNTLEEIDGAIGVLEMMDGWS